MRAGPLEIQRTPTSGLIIGLGQCLSNMRLQYRSLFSRQLGAACQRLAHAVDGKRSAAIWTLRSDDVTQSVANASGFQFDIWPSSIVLSKIGHVDFSIAVTVGEELRRDEDVIEKFEQRSIRFDLRHDAWLREDHFQYPFCVK